MTRMKTLEESLKIVGGDGSIFEVDLKRKKPAMKTISGMIDPFIERGQVNRRLVKFLNRDQRIVWDKD